MTNRRNIFGPIAAKRGGGSPPSIPTLEEVLAAGNLISGIPIQLDSNNQSYLNNALGNAQVYSGANNGLIINDSLGNMSLDASDRKLYNENQLQTLDYNELIGIDYILAQGQVLTDDREIDFDSLYNLGLINVPYGGFKVNNGIFHYDNSLASTYVGEDAGNSNGSSNCIMIGDGAGQTNIGGERSIFIGNAAGQNNTFRNVILFGENAVATEESQVAFSNRFFYNYRLNLADLTADSERIMATSVPLAQEVISVAGVTADATTGDVPIGAAIAETTFPSGNISFTAVQAPSGANFNTYRWAKVGNIVYYRINISYAISGISVSAINLVLPNTMPIPANITGFATANSWMEMASGNVSNTREAFGVAQVGVNYNGGAYSIRALFTSLSSAGGFYGIFTGFYFT